MTAKIFDKRKRVMSRSIKLGHCVCDPKKPCPCPVFKEKDVCTCAGESVPIDTTNKYRLTDFVRSAGCASKIGQKDLHKVLSMLPEVSDPRILVGTTTADDAGVFMLNDQTAIVQTVDVFTPGVDDPFLFGKIAACNSLSDVYAMGGKPVTALSIIGFPIYSLPHEAMADIIKGGMSVLKEAGTILLGGHSINDEEIKFGFAVTGVIDPTKIISNAGAKPGDMLILTKPLGTGIISLAGQINRASDESLNAMIKSMTTLNKTGAEIMTKYCANAGTDVTGFGLAGHLCRMMIESKVTAEIWMDQLPLLPRVEEYAKGGMYSGANERNSEFTAGYTEFEQDTPEHMKAVIYDAQTSGGLLMSIPAENAEKALDELLKAGLTDSAIIGTITEASEGKMIFKAGKPACIKSPTATKGAIMKEISKETPSEAIECCSPTASNMSDDKKSIEVFGNFLNKAMQPGAIDIVTKELMAIALGLAVNCVPCTKIHLKKAASMGIGKDELEEAAALAIAFGGCRALMLWNELKKEI